MMYNLHYNITMHARWGSNREYSAFWPAAPLGVARARDTSSRMSWRSPPGRYKSLLLRQWDLEDNTSSANGRPDDSETKVL